MHKRKAHRREFKSRLLIRFLRRAAFAGGIVSLLLSSDPCRAQTVWINPAGGLWNNGFNWTGGSPPTPGSVAIFNNNSTYAVNWSGVDTITSGLVVNAGNVTFANATTTPRTYSVIGNSVVGGGAARLTIGSSPSNIMTLNTNGLLITDGSEVYVIAGSQINSNALVTVGNHANPQRSLLEIASGGIVQADTMRIGDGGVGGVNVLGPGSRLTTNGSLTVGYSPGANFLRVLDGGTVQSTTGIIGRNLSSAGAFDLVTVGGSGSQWLATSLEIGIAGDGLLQILNGGQVLSNSAPSLLGNLSTSEGAVAVSGAGSFWSVFAPTIGGAGTGRLIIEDGGVVNSRFSTSVTVGDMAGGTGSIIVRGQGSTFNAVEQGLPSRMTLGRSGSAEMLVQSGGTVNSDEIRIGEFASGSGIVTVTGPGSRWNARQMNIGMAGLGSIVVENGGEVVSGFSNSIGSAAGGDGLLRVSGAGSRWVGSLDVGSAGTGTLEIQSGGLVDNLFNLVGINGGSGMINISDVGSRLNYDTLNVGMGSINIQSGALVSGISSIIGSGNNATANVSGSGSTWDNLANLIVGQFGTGSLVVQQGGRMSTGNAIVSEYTASQGTVTVNGTGSQWLIGDSLQVGLGQTGIVNIENQGLVSVGGTVAVANGGQIRLNGGRYEFGNTDVASFTRVLKNSGSAAGDINIAGTNNLASMNGLITDGANLNQVHLVNSGLLQGTNQVDVSLENTASGELLADAGDWIRFRGNENSNAGLIQNNGGVVQFAQMSNLADGVVQGSGTFVSDTNWSNVGTMSFFGGNTDLIGDIVNHADGTITTSGAATTNIYGNLVHNGAGIGTAAGSNTIIRGMASGAGDYLGDGMVTMEGGFDPGNSPELVNFFGSLTFGSQNTTTIELDGFGANEFDQLFIDGDLFLNDSQLDVAVDNSFLLAPDMEFLIAEIVGSRFGFFAGLGEGSLVGNFAGQDLYISYNAGSGNDIALYSMTTVPEPGTMLPMLALAGAISFVRRRK